MTGTDILNRTSTAKRHYADGSTVEVQIPIIDPSRIGTVDETVLAAWTAEAATLDATTRHEAARRLRIALMDGKRGGSPSLATTAALIDMLEA